MSRVSVLVVFVPLIYSIFVANAARSRFGESPEQMKRPGLDTNLQKNRKHAFTSPDGYFIQEFASKQLPGSGQHFNFGALKPWEDIIEKVANTPDTKLLLVVRHGEALSNWLENELGPDDWYQAESKCHLEYGGKEYSLFDAELTDKGVDQAYYLSTILNGGGWFSRMTGNFSTRLIVSPLSRCLRTAMIVSEGLGLKTVSVEESARETLGRDTCDARRAVSDLGEGNKHASGPCSYTEGLKTKFPQFDFPVVGPYDGEEVPDFGMVSDEDSLWTDEREKQKQQVRRATAFLHKLFDYSPEKVSVLVTHSGFVRSLLLAAEREPYRPQNSELVPVIVTRVIPDADDE